MVGSENWLRLKPSEYIDPDWSEPRGKYVHDWRAYIGDDLRNIWSTFTSDQKLAVARNAQVIADGEDWD